MSAAGRPGAAPVLPNTALEHDRPVLVYCDDATGERTALSAAALRAWVNRTANLVANEGVSLAAVLLPPHWQTAAVLLGAWTAGLSVEYQGLATAGLPRIGSGAKQRIDVTFVVGSELVYGPPAPVRFLVRLGGDERPPVPGYREYLREAATQDDEFHVAGGRRRTDSASPDGTTYEEWGRLARELAEMSCLRPGDRVLVDAAEHDHPAKWLLAPLAVGGSIVLCANLDQAALAERIDAEGVTRVL
jgi:uncharacterized protein (TIGR03089 family)